MKKLLRFHDTYLDEFDIDGFVIVDQKGWEDFVKVCDDIRSLMQSDNIPYIYLEIGGAIELGYESIDDVLSYIEVEDITDEVQAEVLGFFFGNRYGYFPDKFLADWLHDMIVERDMR